VLVVSRAGWPDQIASDHRVATLAEAALLHSGRPTVVTVGIGATAIVGIGTGSTSSRKIGGFVPSASPQQ
jgi:hypothetical protein